MSSPFTVRRRAADFAAAVDGGAGADSGGRSLGAGLDDLVGVVTLLREHQQPDPRPEFVSDLRERLMAEAATELRPESARLLLPERPRGRRERTLVAAASAVVVLGGTASMAAAAQDALPGELLYPVKRGIERVEAELSLSPAGEGRDLLRAAGDRLTEVDGLLDSDAAGSKAQVSGTLEDFATQARAGSDLLLDSYTDTRDPESVVTVRTFAADSVAHLEDLASEVPPSAQDELSAAALLLREIDSTATELCGSCAANLPDLRVPGILLARAEVDRALEAVSADDLDNSHPVVVPKRRDSAAGDRSQANGGAATAADAPLADGAPEGPDQTGTSGGGVSTGAVEDEVPDADQPSTDDPTRVLDQGDDELPGTGLEADLPTSPETSDGGSGPVGDTVEDTVEDTAKTVEDTAEELDEAVETILPDSDGGLLP